MTPLDGVVIAAGLAAIAWVNWYFFLAGRTPAVAATATGGIQRVAIQVLGGYSPNSVRVTAGRPVRLEFNRAETNSCTEEVVLADFGVRRFLPAHQTTAVEFTPTAPGSYRFSCGMGMVHGTLIVDPAQSEVAS